MQNVESKSPVAALPTVSLPAKDSNDIKEVIEVQNVDEHPPNVWVGIASAVAWPIALVALVIMLLCSKSLKRALGLTPKLVRKIKAGGVEMEINADVADDVRNLLENSINELLDKARTQYRQAVILQQIDYHLSRALISALPRVLTAKGLPSKGPKRGDDRGTVHVQDIVFPEYLYQLTDYFPRQLKGGSNRRFSQRFGVIGRVWRLEQSIGEGDAVYGAPAEEKLVKEWGMTREEALSPTRTRPADLCVLLRSPDDGNSKIGILYIDSSHTNSFGNEAQATDVAIALAAEPEILELAKAIARGMAPLRLAAPNIEITK